MPIEAKPELLEQQITHLRQQLAKLPGDSEANETALIQYKLAQTLDQLGQFHLQSAAYQAAASLLEEALSLFEDLLNQNNPYTGVLLADFSLCCRHFGRCLQEEDKQSELGILLQRELRVWEKQVGIEHFFTQSLMQRFATWHQKQGHYRIAEQLLRQIVSFRERHQGPLASETAYSLERLAACYEAQARYYQASASYRRALAIFEECLTNPYQDSIELSHQIKAIRSSLARIQHCFPHAGACEQLRDAPSA
jgi:tetratricopeptide (TPR) repeat protein